MQAADDLAIPGLEQIDGGQRRDAEAKVPLGVGGQGGDDRVAPARARAAAWACAVRSAAARPRSLSSPAKRASRISRSIRTVSAATGQSAASRNSPASSLDVREAAAASRPEAAENRSR